MRQVYVSPVESRGKGGYSALVDVLSDAQQRAAFLAQALAEYQRVGDRYADIKELSQVRAAVARVAAKRATGRKAA